MTGKLRLMLVGPVPPPPGGMANQTEQLKRLLEQEGVEVVLVQTNRPYWPNWVGQLPVVRALFRLVPYLSQLVRQAEKSQVVHVMANSGWAWYLLAAPAIHILKWSGRPVIVNYRGGLAREFLKKSVWQVGVTLRGTRLIVPTAFLQEVFANHGILADVIPNVVDTEVFQPSHHAINRKTSDKPHVVVARNLEKIYGIDIGLRALAVLKLKMPGLHASVAGTGPERQTLEDLAVKLGLEKCVRFVGRLDVPGMVQLYQSADVVMNPVRADNAPNSVLEALACAIPVVSTRVGGVPFLIEHGETGWLVDQESPEALAEGLATVLRNEQLRQHLTLRGLELARGCSWSVVRNKWLQAYKSLQR